jgi:hypothetical protein
VVGEIEWLFWVGPGILWKTWWSCMAVRWAKARVEERAKTPIASRRIGPECITNNPIVRHAVTDV